MKRYIIEPLRDWGVIIKGPLQAAVLATSDQGIHRPLRDVHVNGYGAIHANVTTDRETLDRWFAASHDRQPGALLFFLGPNDQRGRS